MEPQSKSNLVIAVLGVMQELQNGIEKNSVVGTGGNSYKGISDKDVKMNIGRAMVKHGLIILPISVNAKTTVYVWDETVQYAGQAPVSKRKKEVFTEATTQYKLMHLSGEYEIIEGLGHGVDTQDKGSGKATTYALKYALLYTFLVATGEIDDADKIHSDEMATPPATAEKPKKAKEAKVAVPAEPQSVSINKDPEPVPSETKTEVTTVPNQLKPGETVPGNKKMLTDAQVIAYSIRVPNESGLFERIKGAFELTAEQLKKLEAVVPSKQDLPAINLGQFIEYKDRVKAGEPGVIPECLAKYHLIPSQLEELRNAIPKLKEEPSKDPEPSTPEIKKMTDAPFRAMLKKFKGGDAEALTIARNEYLPFSDEQEATIKKYTETFYPGGVFKTA